VGVCGVAPAIGVGNRAVWIGGKYETMAELVIVPLSTASTKFAILPVRVESGRVYVNDRVVAAVAVKVGVARPISFRVLAYKPLQGGVVVPGAAVVERDRGVQLVAGIEDRVEIGRRAGRVPATEFSTFFEI